MVYLHHTLEQAQQCAVLVHNKGRCAVKNGSKAELLPYKVALSDAGLTTEIE